MIDIVIPVYGGVAQTRCCIESALASIDAALGRIVVVDDASPEPEIVDYVRGLGEQGRIDHIRNESNQGFVRSVNRGMALHRDRDVVLLNSDTQVANPWLERLRAAAYRDSNIATVTPFSNNATICTYPFDGWGGGVPGTLGLAGLDRLFATANAGQSVDIPTAVGFCMYIRRDALDAVGPFDEERFGRGYGEENDFCMRALKAGRRNVLAGDVFVFHEGGVSFSDERGTLMDAAAAALLEAHPDYGERVQEFIAADPAQPLRASVDLARAQSGVEEAQHVLRERCAECASWMSRTRELQRFLAGREAHISELHRGLERATALVAERGAALESMQGSIETLQRDLGAEMAHLREDNEKLRAGLAQAEALAFSREQELNDIRRSWAWRFYNRARRRSAS
jgi:GT2 family glycosyltransferase